VSNRGIKDDLNLDENIKDLFQKNMTDIKLDNFFKEKLIAMKNDVKPVSPVRAFLEKEICIPVASVSAAAGVMIIVAGFLINSLLLPGEIPQPKYQIIEMMQISEAQLNVKD